MSAHEATHVEEADHGTVKSFTTVWIFLLIFTAIDVSAVYWHFLDGLWVYLLLLFLVWG